MCVVYRYDQGDQSHSYDEIVLRKLSSESKSIVYSNNNREPYVVI